LRYEEDHWIYTILILRLVPISIKNKSNFSPARPPHSLNTGRIKKRENLYTPQRPPIYNVPSEKEKGIREKPMILLVEKEKKGKEMR
jgi:hypothetical protein